MIQPLVRASVRAGRAGFIFGAAMFGLYVAEELLDHFAGDGDE
jgi:hypothetical protein